MTIRLRGAGAVTINLANLTPELQPASITFDNATRDYTLNGTGFIGGGTGITKSGAAKVTLANSAVNTLTGPGVINAGTLQIGDGVNSGGIPGTQNITDNGAMIIDRPDNSAISGVISGSGSLTQMGTGTTLTLSNANTYTGATTISGATLAVTSLANGGANSSVGKSSNAAANLVMSGAALHVPAKRRPPTACLHSARASTIDASSASNAALNFSNTGAIAFAGAGAAQLDAHRHQHRLELDFVDNRRWARRGDIHRQV